MKIKIPDVITIGGYLFQTRYVDKIPFPKYKDCDGYVDFPNGIIYLKKNPEANQFQIFLHEIIHCIDRIYNADELKSEEEVERISQGLFQVGKSCEWF